PAIDSGETVMIEIVHLTPENEPLFLKALNRFLLRYEMLYLRDSMLTMTRELITNAEKSNAKRLYFESKNLDISSSLDYTDGMKTFKDEVLKPDTDIFQKMEKTKMRIQIIFRVENNIPYIDIRNNIKAVPQELNSIEANISKAYSFKDFRDVFSAMQDDSEGAGLGLILGIMVLRLSNFSKDCFSVKAENNSLTFSIKVFRREDFQEFKHKIADKLSREIDSLPPIPEVVREISSLCDDTEIKIEEISGLIRKDPGLISTILKFANSAWYGSPQKIIVIDDAVKLVGLKKIKTLALVSSVEEIIKSRYPKLKSIWNESYKRAFYAYNISIQLRNNGNSENTYLGALLSNIGKIILLAVDSELLKKLNKISGIIQIPDMEILEEYSLGISHSSLASLIARKWNFDESLCSAIEFHMKPYMALPEFKDITYTIYLANFFMETENKRLKFEQIDSDTAEYFKINSINEFTRLHNILISAYNVQTQ
ncbi:MAG: HDOD domain-containing protein, partial [Spirochaetes bacterium]|nr:HDOD domain-containing protein [Spirochaetota bacterium]